MNSVDEAPRRLSASRRALFPTQDEDSDLGHMSPLSTENSNSDSESTSDAYYFKSLKNHSSDDYDILGNINKIDSDVEGTPMQKKVFSPEHLSLLTSPLLENENTIIPDTPIKESPMLRLETPHDTSIQSAGLPKLARKVQIEEDESPEHKKLDHSGKAKVRTALFPENETAVVPVKSFYAKTDLNLSFCNRNFVHVDEVKRKKKKVDVYLCSRRVKSNRYGQINTGVRHKIKKPKQKKPTKMQILKAAISMIENSPLNEYLNELQQLQNKPTIIEPLQKAATENNKKRQHSPDVTKKFQVAVYGHDFVCTKKPEQNKTIDTENTFDANDDVNLVDNNCISGLIDFLEDDKENARPAKRAKLELLSPISQMCDTTSGLALNSPKKARNLTTVLENMTTATSPQTSNSSSDMEKQQKLFPIFQTNTANKPKKEEKSMKNNQMKKWKSLPPNQMLLDAGQKRFGPTQCPECEIIYHMGDPSEEIMHLNYHNAGNVLRFNGWKNEDVIADFLNARVIRIKPNDSKLWWKKVTALLEVVNRDLGFYDVQLNTKHSHVYLYIKNRAIVGCLVAEQRSLAHKRLEENGMDLCTEETFPVKCGVSRIWVSPNYRREGIGAILMDCLKANFVFGNVLKNEDVALSSPTEMGHNFAKKYFKTSNYLIYM